jgi:hypothetical protein
MIGRFIVGLAALFGALISSQFPEFSAQYRQRLGGALEELRVIVSEFDASATRSGLSRDDALARFDETGEPFLQEQGSSAGTTIRRFENLASQRDRLETASPVMRPVVVLSGPDRRVLEGTWQDYEPAVPVTPSGFVWAALGFFLAGGLVSLIRQVFSAMRRRRAHREEPA